MGSFMHLHEKMAEIRLQKGLTQKEMAKKIHMTTEGYAKLERGERQLKIRRLEQVAAALEMELKDFLEVDGKTVFNGSFHHVESCQNQNYYVGSSKEIVHELENLRLTVEQKDREIELLKEQISQLKQIIGLMRK